MAMIVPASKRLDSTDGEWLLCFLAYRCTRLRKAPRRALVILITQQLKPPFFFLCIVI